jgi:reductive dehalogenase
VPGALIFIVVWLAALILGSVSFLMLAFCVSSVYEREARAAIVSGALGAVLGAVTVGYAMLALQPGINHGPWPILILCFDAAAILVAVLIAVPTRWYPGWQKGRAGSICGGVQRFDERDTVFSRLKASWARPLYIERTGKQLGEDERVPDDFINSLRDGEISGSSLPQKGLIDRGAGGVVVAMAEACAKVTFALERDELLNPQVAKQRIELTPEEATRRVKGYAKQLGAVLCGVAEVERHWLYSNRGVSGVATAAWGEAVEMELPNAVVFAVEMDLELVNPGPHTPCILETMQNYAKAAFIAAQLAAFIAKLGYRAKANQMEHYDGLMVPLAADAGLGELSRMGYLVTKEYGPRVRLNAVFTELPLTPDEPVDIGLTDFCEVCKKCAHCCPSLSIPLDERKEHNGSLRWKLDADTCLKYWQSVGTDCAVCMRVCPWSHARTWPHRLVTELVSRNWIARRVFTLMDDVFYGKKPRAKVPPRWAGCGMNGEEDGVGNR